MAIGNSDFTNNQKKGLAWFFSCADDWASIEPPLILWLQNWATELKLQKNEASTSYRIDMEAIKSHLRAEPEDIPAVKTVLGI